MSLSDIDLELERDSPRMSDNEFESLVVGLCTALKLVGGFGKIIERVFRTRY